MHAANAHTLPQGAFAKVGREGWIDFMEDVGLTSAVLYPTNGLSFGRVVSLDWAIELAQAYNDWMHDEYLSKSSRFQALGLIPLQEPPEAVKELRRIVKELGFCGAMLPSTGVVGRAEPSRRRQVLADLRRSQPSRLLHRHPRRRA